MTKTCERCGCPKLIPEFSGQLTGELWPAISTMRVFHQHTFRVTQPEWRCSNCGAKSTGSDWGEHALAIDAAKAMSSSPDDNAIRYPFRLLAARLAIQLVAFQFASQSATRVKMVQSTCEETITSALIEGVWVESPGTLTKLLPKMRECMLLGLREIDVFLNGRWTQCRCKTIDSQPGIELEFVV